MGLGVSIREPQREMRDSRKGDGDRLLQESMAVFVTSVVLMSLTLYTGSDPRNESDL